MEKIENAQSTSIATRPATGWSAGQYQTTQYGFEGALPEDDVNSGVLAYLRALARHKTSIALTAILGLILGFAAGIPMKPVYRAQTTLEVLSLNQDFMNLKESNPTTTNDGSYETSEEQTQAKLLESAALTRRVIRKMDPADDAIVSLGIPKSGWRSLFHLAQPVNLPPRLALLEFAAKSLKIHPTVRTRVLEVSVDSTDSRVAADFANTLTQEFVAMNMEARWETTQRTSEWLSRELDDARNKLRKSEDALQAYAQGSGLIFTDDSTNVATEKLQQLQQNLTMATADRIAKQSRYELAQSAPSGSLADVLNDISLRDAEAKSNELKRQIADLSAVFNADYSKVKRLQAELDTLEPVLIEQKQDILTRIKNDYTEAARKENLLLAAYNSQAQNVTGQDQKAIQYNILKRDVDSGRQLYDTMLQQMKQSSIASAMRASNVRVVDAAEVPTEPVSPNLRLNSIIGFLSALVIAITVVTIRERADRTLQQPGDIKLWVDLPELGIIPTASIDAQKLLYYRRAKATVASVKSDLPSPNTKGPVELVTWQRQPSLIAEAFRSTLTSILFVGEGSSRPKVLVFTSANAADGKTTVVSNIAIAAAEIRLKVLLIDADLRRPRLHQIFSLNNDAGLIDALQGDSKDIELESIVRRTTIPNLDVITAGSATSAAPNLLYSPNLALLLNQFRASYDLIMVDTPPMLQMTDARVVSRLADVVILVGRANLTTRDALTAARDRFREDRSTVLGAILNDWNPRNAPGGYYGSYSGGYINSYNS